MTVGKHGRMPGQVAHSAADGHKNGRCTLNEMGSEHLPLLKPDGYEAITVQHDSSSFRLMQRKQSLTHMSRIPL